MPESSERNLLDESKMKFPVWLKAMAWAVLIAVALMDVILLCNR